MAIFDSLKKQYLTFYIALTDAAQVAARQTQFGAGGVNRAPYNSGPPASGAAVEFSAPWITYGDPKPIGPYSYSDVPTADATHPYRYPINVSTFTRTTGSIFGIGGTTIKYFWMGKFVLAADSSVPPGAPLPDVEANIPKRRWAEGFETPGIGACTNAPSSGFFYSRDAARHVGGIGLALRGANNSYAQVSTEVFGTATNRNRSWERFYLRLRKLPSDTRRFWRWADTVSSNQGVILGITAAGQIACYKMNAALTESFIQTIDAGLEVWSGLGTHNAWKRIDILIDSGTASPAVPASTRIYVDGVFKASIESDQGAFHQYSRLGGLDAGVNDLFLDVDDWHNAEIPSRTVSGSPVESLNGKDFLGGTKIVLVKPTEFSASHGAWTGDVRTVMQNAVATGLPPKAITSASAGAVCAVTTNSGVSVDADRGSIGVAAIQVSLFGARGVASNDDGQLGYKLAGGAPVLATVAMTTTYTAESVMFSNHTTQGEGGGRPVIADVTPIELQFKKDTSAVAASVVSLLAQAELIGRWGPEDYAVGEDTGVTSNPAASVGQHNAPYPNSPWATRGAGPPMSPYIVKGGTYTGNATGQDLLFRAPVHWLWIRPLTGDIGGSLWLSPLVSGHRGRQEGVYAGISNVEEDPTFAGGSGEGQQETQYRVRIQGDDAAFNANAITYQYIAVMDPGMRYMLNLPQASRAGSPALATDVRPLVSAGFRADWDFILHEGLNATSTQRLHAKGPGHVGTESIASFAGATLTDALNLDTPGTITTKPALHAITDGQGILHSLWRRSDGNQDTGEARVVNIGSYVGDGSASRTVNLAPASGRRPMFAIVVPGTGGGVGYFRDPSHTTTTSTNSSGNISSSGITAGGIDSFSVAAGLNANGAIYNYFVLFGIADCQSNNGWGCNGEVVVVEPYPHEDPYPEEPTDPEIPIDPGDPDEPDPGGPVDPTPDFSVECAPRSTWIINAALSRIGVSKQIANIRTEVSEEGYKARLLYGLDVEQTLRDFPWPFATKFATLVLVGGTSSVPVNADWQYSYRRPSDCVFARRLVRARGGAVDPTPPQFQLGSDTTAGLTGELLFTNEVAPTLEYTARVVCAATSGDYLFREALIWRHAASLAGPIARSADLVVKCLEEYRKAIAHAEDVIKPGTPGLLAGGTADPEAALKKNVINRALVRIGARMISDYTLDQSREAQSARAVFTDEYQATLRDFPWAFATTYATLTLVSGTPAAPVNQDWIYAYRVPTGALAVRRLVREGIGRAWDAAPPRFRLATDATGGLLFTDEATAILEYTATVTLASSDVLFRDALAWRIAASLAPSLAGVDPDLPEQLGRGPDPNALTTPGWRQHRPESRAQARQRVADRAMQMYLYTLAKAQAGAQKEQQQPPDGDANWIAGRD